MEKLILHLLWRKRHVQLLRRQFSIYDSQIQYILMNYKIVPTQFTEKYDRVCLQTKQSINYICFRRYLFSNEPHSTYSLVYSTPTKEEFHAWVFFFFFVIAYLCAMLGVLGTAHYTESYVFPYGSGGEASFTLCAIQSMYANLINLFEERDCCCLFFPIVRF